MKNLRKSALSAGYFLPQITQMLADEYKSFDIFFNALAMNWMVNLSRIDAQFLTWVSILKTHASFAGGF
jgi:hypothetical protein